MSTTPKNADPSTSATAETVDTAAASASTPQPLIADSDALLMAQIDALLLPGTGRTPEELEEIAELDALPPISDDDLARQAEAAPGDDGDPSTPE